MPRSPAEELVEGGVHTAAGRASYEPGFVLAPITAEARAKYRLDAEQRGLVVTEVTPNSPAAERGIEPGDVVVRVGGDPVETPDGVSALITTARKENRPYLLLLVSGPGGQRFVALPLHPET